MMFKQTIIAVLVSAIALPVYADTYVKGYYRNNGTYVQPHMRSNRDNNFDNNWSKYGNINPYTGKIGTKVNPTYSYPNTIVTTNYPNRNSTLAYIARYSQMNQPKNSTYSNQVIKFNEQTWYLNAKNNNNLIYVAEGKENSLDGFPVVSIVYIGNPSEKGNPMWLSKNSFKIKYDCNGDKIALLSEKIINSKNETLEEFDLSKTKASKWESASNYLDVDKVKRITNVCDFDTIK